MTQETMQSTTTSLASQIIDLVNWNSWAAERIAAWLRTKPEEVLAQEVPSSFPCIKDTMLHIQRTEQYWLGLLKNIKDRPVYGDSFEGTAAELFDGFTAQSAAFVSHVHKMTDEDMQRPCSFLAPVRWPEWDEFNRPAAELIMHAMYHSTYHRGQIITIGRNIGLTDAPMTDYMYYLLMAK